MKVVRHKRLLVAMHTSGPTHNFLGLDFATDVPPYERDLGSGGAGGGVNIEDVRRQLQRAVDSFDSASTIRPQVVGINYVSTDTPSETVYHLLAMEILENLSRMEELETFEPTWLS